MSESKLKQNQNRATDYYLFRLPVWAITQYQLTIFRVSTNDNLEHLHYLGTLRCDKVRCPLVCPCSVSFSTRSEVEK